MIDNIIGNKTIRILEKSLNAASMRHGVISNNLANVDTPGHKVSRVVFEEELKKALDGKKSSLPLKTTLPAHISLQSPKPEQVNPVLVDDKTTIMRNDGNNVDIDIEMALLAKNTLYFNTLVQQISGRFASIKNVISEGRR